MERTNQMGPPRGNKNALSHGLSSGRLPKGCSSIGASVNAMLRALETATLKAKGEVSIVDAALIQSACRWERHSQLAARWLRLAFAELTYDERLRYSRETARASSERDKAIGALRLDGVAWGPALGMLDPLAPAAIEGPDDDGGVLASSPGTPDVQP
jgi:hypothetical protein